MTKLPEVLTEIIHTACRVATRTDEETEAGREARPVRKNLTTKKSVKWPEGFSVEMEKNGRKIVGVITECGAYIDDNNYPYRYFSTVYDGDAILFSITSCARGLCFQRRVLKSAMSNALMQLTHSIRNRKNKAAKRRAAITTPAEELAETVRRQKEGEEK